MTTVMEGLEVVVLSDAEVGEGPVLDGRTGDLIWVDLTGGILFESDVTTGRLRQTHIGRTLGAAVPRFDQPGFAVAVAEGFGLVVDGSFTLIDSALADSAFRMNDAKCDAKGRLWAGSTRIDFGSKAGALHRWDGRTPSVRVAAGFTLPNGLGWDAGNSVMYLDDSVQQVMMAAPFDLESGTVGVFETRFAIEGGLPDGLAVDVDGCLWVAIWGAWEVRRYRPDGTVDCVIRTPVSQPSSCAFGADGVLYITSAKSGVSNETLAGSVFAIQTHTTGVEIASFAA